ncbi:MAG: TatD family hydrolase [Sphaerochaetaceae bacterium]|jgi:TatD DNase family protein|nr:TatD family hydrolase [Sphaerochaetaceae bacterium]
MVDAHLHLPLPAATVLDDQWVGLPASSGPSQWDSLRQDPLCRDTVCFYGLLPQEFAHIPPNDEIVKAIGNIESFLDDNPRAAIGEIGFDRRYEHTVPMKTQHVICNALIDIAESRNRPVVFHIVRCDGILVTLLRQRKPKIPMLWHNFLGSVETAREASTLGCTVSISPFVWRKNVTLQKHLSSLPKSFLLETDYDRDFHPPEDQALLYHEVLHMHYRRCADAIGTGVDELVRRCHEYAAVYTNK